MALAESIGTHGQVGVGSVGQVMGAQLDQANSTFERAGEAGQEGDRIRRFTTHDKVKRREAQRGDDGTVSRRKGLGIHFLGMDPCQGLALPTLGLARERTDPMDI